MTFAGTTKGGVVYQPDPVSLPRLGTIPALIEAAQPVAKPFSTPPRILCKLPGGELYFDSKLELDTDGWPDGKKPDGSFNGDPSWQPDTSLNYANGKSINANAVPYFVLPKPKPWSETHGVFLGDYAAVIFRTRVAFAVFADRGPADKIGEGSIELLRRLGEERIKADGSVRNVGMGPRIITIVFPGSGKTAHRTNQAALLAKIDERGRALFTALGGVVGNG
jgi:hypothetical protein